MQYITDLTKSHHQTLHSTVYCNSWPQFLSLSHIKYKKYNTINKEMVMDFSHILSSYIQDLTSGVYIL